jgi:transcription elongation factor Elf1
MPDIFGQEEWTAADDYVNRRIQAGIKKINDNGKFTCPHCKGKEIIDMEIRNFNGRAGYNMKCKSCEKWIRNTKP